jgi:hypothetical protein
MDYSELIEELTQSFTCQIEIYKQLQVIVQKILGQIALSRGDFSGVMGLFEEKQKLLEKIEKERVSTNKNVEIWQKEKENIPLTNERELLDKILAETEKVIKDFLVAEDQLKTYLEHNINSKGNTSGT